MKGKQMFPLSPQANSKAQSRPRTGKEGFNRRLGQKSNIPLPGKNQHNILIKDNHIEISNYELNLKGKRSPNNHQLDPHTKGLQSQALLVSPTSSIRFLSPHSQTNFRPLLGISSASNIHDFATFGDEQTSTMNKYIRNSHAIKIEKNITETIQVFSEEEIESIYKAKCFDCGNDFKKMEPQLIKFKQYVMKTCVNRKLIIREMNLGLRFAKTL